MGWNIKQNADGTVSLVDGAAGKPDDAVIFGRGATDTDITWLALRNATGVLTYIYPNATADGVTVANTKP
ncbi:hypothetical protein [Inquilinus limosus]|uniref:Uncharacterized protein n=1 Tax=Inquilinus limosus TaxID=171674 RepID=A0A211ZQ90_9PROT|nr:hypothetical protein [Inquilinus limosus]OWJ67443.1 hypothetical protein BWR60_09565 [Inquilinus limosus]